MTTPSEATESEGELLGKGNYGTVFKEHRVVGNDPLTIQTCAVKRIQPSEDYQDSEYNVERRAFCISGCIHEKHGIRILPRLYESNYSSTFGAEFAMDIYDETGDAWIANEVTNEDHYHTAYMIFQVFIRMLALHSIGVYHNDIFLRNVMIRRAERGTKGDVTEYVLRLGPEFTTHFMVRDSSFDVVLIDCGLCSGSSVGIPHKTRMLQFSETKGRHPLQSKNAQLRPYLVDHCCLCMSVLSIVSKARKRSRHVGQGLQELYRFSEFYRSCIDRDMRDQEIFRRVLGHPFFGRLIVRGVPDRILNLSSLLYEDNS